MWFQKKCPLQLELASQCGEFKTSATKCSYFLGSSGMAAKTISKTFAKSWMKGMAWFERWETQPFLKFILCGISNMRSDRFCKGKKRQIFDIFLFSTRFHICSQAFDMIWFHPSTLTQQHKSLVKIRKSAKRKQNLTLVASLNQLWRNRPVKESVWFFMCYMTSYLTLLLVGIPHPSFQPAISFQTFCLGKKSAFFNVRHHAWLRRRWSEHPILVLSPLLKLMAHRCKGFLAKK